MIYTETIIGARNEWILRAAEIMMLERTIH